MSPATTSTETPTGGSRREIGTPSPTASSRIAPARASNAQTTGTRPDAAHARRARASASASAGSGDSFRIAAAPSARRQRSTSDVLP